MKSPSFLAAAVVATLVLSACGGSTVSTPDPVSLDGEKTWYGVVGPLVQSRCAVCHRSGDIAPFSLENYDLVMAQIDAIKEVVTDKVMPPFPPDQSDASGCPKIDDLRQMSDDERAVLLGWIEAGAPAGDVRDLPEAKPNKPLGDPAYTWSMSQPYTSLVTNGDDYRCFLVRTNNTVDVPVAAVSVLPGQRSIVHHAAVYLIPPDQIATASGMEGADGRPGYECFGGINIAESYPAGVWVPGNDAPLVPPSKNVGYYLPPGWAWVIQVHYNLHGPAEPDTSSVVLWQNDLLITQVPHAIIAGKFDFALPPNSMSAVDIDADVTASSVTPAVNSGWEGKIYAVWGHQHLLGQSLMMDVVHPDGTKQCLLHIPKWDFHWQSIYKLKDFVSVSAGDKIHVTCNYLNSTSRTVSYGEGTLDEMCLASIAALNP